MAIDMVWFWEKNFRRSVTQRAQMIRTEEAHERWVKECAAWRTHIVETEAKRLGMDGETRKALSEACVRAFDEINVEVCDRLYGSVVAHG